VSTPLNPAAQVDVSLYRTMLKIRITEEILAELYKEQEMRTPTHFSIGQEAVATGVCETLDIRDVVYSGHRSHAQYLAKGGGLEGLVAELYGKESGASRGRGGSVHLTAREVGYIASTAILGETIAVAVGSALAFKMDKERRVAVCFFGDGSVDEGICAESLNFASLHKLPVIFVCENNMYSTQTPMSDRIPAGATIFERAGAFLMRSMSVDGYDVRAVYESAQQARELCLAGDGPVFLECSTYRWREHVGPYEDHELGYRTKEELDSWKARDPIVVVGETLVATGICSQTDLDGWKQEIESEVSAAAAMAKTAPFPDVSDLFDGLY
jgi:TPP-dependent pyruvate/acetoin dehydrogenase alpha subunit